MTTTSALLRSAEAAASKASMDFHNDIDAAIKAHKEAARLHREVADRRRDEAAKAGNIAAAEAHELAAASPSWANTKAAGEASDIYRRGPVALRRADRPL